MRRYYVPLLLSFLLVGCGGGFSGLHTGASGDIIDGSGHPGGSSAVLFAGRWAGTYTSESDSDHGVIALNVGSDANVTGTIQSSVLPRTAQITGRSVNGLITATYRYTGVASPYEGQFDVHNAANGHLVGKIVQFYTSVGNTGNGPTLDIDLAPN